MTQPIRFGLIGVGGIGSYHRTAIQGLESAGMGRLIAVADPWIQRLATQKADLEARGVRWHLDYRDMLREEAELDAVVIATPIPFHYEMTLACIKRGLAIHLEKPPVPLIQQLDALIAADAKRTVSVGFQYIGSHCTQELKRLITEGNLGQLREIRAAACWPRSDKYYARANWAGRMMLDSAPVFDGPATNALAHLIQNIMFLAGEGRDDFAEPVEVQGELYRARPIESYDTACMRGRFATGTEFSVTVTHATESPLPFCIEVRGTEGWARLSLDGAKLETSAGVICDRPESTQQLINSNYGNFLDVIHGRRERFLTRLVDTRGYVSTTNAMLLSSGGVHDIDPAAIRRYTRDGAGGFEVLKLREAVEENLASGRLFTEQGCAWATAKPRPFQLPLGRPTPLAEFCGPR
jgi:predicted dehydrogenase